MRIKTFAKGGYIDGGFTSGGGTMTGPLVLFGDPTKDLEAATKQYVDSKTATFSADKFTSGTLQTGRLPVLTGDVVSSTGSNAVSLVNSGVSAGVFTKVTVNAKGLITAGGSLVESDIPALDWSKFTTGKPTNLAGYGITDALTKAGGTVTGALTLHADPTSANHLVTKQYVDNIAGGASALKTGDIISKMSSSTPSGFLRCNGSAISKMSYSALYSAVGDAFTLNYNNAVAGAGQPWKQQYNFNTNSLTDVNNWTNANIPLPNAITSGRAFVTKNRVYFLGGYIGSSGKNTTIYALDIDNAGAPVGTWKDVGTSPSTLDYFEVVVTKNRVYIIGGLSYSVAQNRTWSAPIDADGVLGAWIEGTTLPATTARSPCIVTNNRVYVFSNSGNSTVGPTFTATIDGNGYIGAWSSVGTNPVSTMSARAIVIKNFVYLIGNSTSIYRCGINSDGTLDLNWSVASNMPITAFENSIFTTKNRLFIFGGAINGSYSELTYSVAINADGSLGTWTQGTSLPTSTSETDIIATSSRLILMGLSNGVGTVYSALFSGGQNDYTPYFNGAGAPTNTSDFRLPDLTSSDLTGTYSYIKT